MSRTFAGAAAAALALFAALPAGADAFPSDAAPSRVIYVPRDKSLSFSLDLPASKIVVAQPDTAEIVATTDHSFYVRGREYGSTNLLVYAPGGRLREVIDVRVGYDAVALQDDLRKALPAETIRVQTLGEGLLLSGEVSTPAAVAKAKALAERFAPDAVTSMLTARAAQQVVLEVRVLEASRTALQDVGFRGLILGADVGYRFGNGLTGNSPGNGLLQARGSIGSVSFDVILEALEEKGVIRTLARPNLVAVSGEKASFLAGGEFPYPVPQDLDKITLEFRTYGVKLDFQPVVQDNGLIRLVVAPEVSQLDPANSLRVNGVTVPGLITRRTSTTVELRNGDAFAIAGLLQHDYQNTVRQFPVLGNVPVLSALFRSSRWKRNETELVVVVTPRLATEEDFRVAAQAGVSGHEPTAIDVILNGAALDRPLKRKPQQGPVIRPAGK
jgi:pilus assembly protein CpaC